MASSSVANVKLLTVVHNYVYSGIHNVKCTGECGTNKNIQKMCLLLQYIGKSFYLAFESPYLSFLRQRPFISFKIFEEFLVKRGNISAQTFDIFSCD